MRDQRSTTRLLAAGTLALTMVLAACSTFGDPEVAADHRVNGEPLGEHGLPETLVVSSYSVGTATYAEVGAVSEALTNEFDINVRQMSSDTGIGRLTPLASGQANYARASLEYVNAFEGEYEYTDREWGPQDLRTVWTPPSYYGVGVNAGGGIESISDLKGKRVPWAPGNPSAQAGILALLAYGGLDINDVEKVDVGYGDWPDALRNGEIDMLNYTVNAANIQEMASTMDFAWLDLEGGSRKALNTVGSTYSLAEFTSPAGMEGQDRKTGFSYTLPLVTYADYSADEVYTFVKAVDETFDDYANTTDTTKSWDIDTIDWTPKGTPHHAGLVRYLKKQGLWTKSDQAAQNKLVQRSRKLDAGWDRLLENEDLAGEELEEAWHSWKKQTLDPR